MSILISVLTLSVMTIAEEERAPAVLSIRPSESEIVFTISRSEEEIGGSVQRLSGEVVVDPTSPSRGPSVVLRVEAPSLMTGNRLRDRKMRKKHLDVGQYPEIIFRSTAIHVAPGETGSPDDPLLPGEKRRALVEGMLDLHGVSREILFPVLIHYDNGSLTAEGELYIRLTDHGIPVPRFLWMVLDDEVKVRFRFAAAPDDDGSSSVDGSSGDESAGD